MIRKNADKYRVKRNRYIFLFITVIYLFGCNAKPVGESLLTKGTSTTTEDTVVDTDDLLEITADSDSLTAFIDDTNKVEITGKCKDLDRKNNRIIVEVFAGEDETTLRPYISNSFSNLCLDTTGGNSNEAGLSVGLKCLWVTNGTGITEDLGLPTERSFPQCHNGRFGFAFRVGKILLPTAGSVNLKYTVRMKLRTLDGILSDSGFNRVLVNREMRTPLINSATYSEVAGGIECSVKSSPARFNDGLIYTLERTYTDILSTDADNQLRYSLTTATIVDGASVFNFIDAINSNLLISNTILFRGVTYNYKLTSTENNFSYAPLIAPTKVSSVQPCVVAPPVLSTTPPTPDADSCFLEVQGTMNPAITAGLGKYEWGYNTIPDWIGPDHAQNVSYSIPTGADCIAGTTSKCTQDGLNTKSNYFFAVREVDITGTIKGKWSNTFQCRTQ